MGGSSHHGRHILAAASYAAVSVVATLSNKAVLSTWEFDHLHCILFAQNLLTVCCIASAQRLPPPEALGSALRFPLADSSIARTMLPTAAVSLLNILAGLTALRMSSVPVYQTLKRMSPLPAMLLDTALRRKQFSFAVRASIALICVGAFVAGAGDLDRSLVGYGFAAASCVLQALYLVLAARAVDARPLSALGVLYYNSLLSLPPLLLATLCEWRDLASYPHWLERSFLAIFIANLATGAALSFTLFYCTLVNSPVTTLIVGNAKAIATTALGFAIFGSRLSSLGLFGIGLNTAGGVAYSIAKHSESQRLVTK